MYGHSDQNAGLIVIKCSDLVFENLAGDVFRDIAHLFPELLATYRVVLYAGIWDFVAGPVGVDRYLRELADWPARDDYVNSARQTWRVEGNVAGYFKHVDRMTMIYVVGSGHFVPTNQPARALDMLNRVLEDRGFCNPEVEICSELNDYCRLLDCQHGRCENGRCVCNDGFTGVDCGSEILTGNVDDFDREFTLEPLRSEYMTLEVNQEYVLSGSQSLTVVEVFLHPSDECLRVC